MNDSPSKSTGKSPHFALHGMERRSTAEANLEMSTEASSRIDSISRFSHNTKSKQIENYGGNKQNKFSIGDHVMVKNFNKNKLFDKNYTGPYVIMKNNGLGAFTININGKHKNIDQSHLIKYNKLPIKDTPVRKIDDMNNKKTHIVELSSSKIRTPSLISNKSSSIHRSPKSNDHASTPISIHSNSKSIDTTIVDTPYLLPLKNCSIHQILPCASVMIILIWIL